MMRTNGLFIVRTVLFGLLGGSLFGFGFTASTHSDSAALDVRVVTDEADAVLAILTKKQDGQAITEADWQRVLASEGYVRLKKREAAMRRAFADDAFKTFVLSDTLAERAAAIAETLNQWKRADVSASVGRALAYLPKGARIRAKIYPVIKPLENSFVFEAQTDPAIFLYIDPAKTREQFENTLAHELHHIGYSGSCAAQDESPAFKKLPPNVQTLRQWVGAFGEGAAMLAAAGGPDVHPHETSKAEGRARWDKDMANFNDDLKRVEKFFMDILEKRLTEEARIRAAGFAFFGVQGPWYTVGWKMAVTIEKTYGRARLIDSLCDTRKLLALWSTALIKGISNPGK
jgi:hypothetical protein